jgi:hypothetical protein
VGSYAELQAARTAAVSQVAEDLAVQGQARRHQLQVELQDLVAQVNVVQAQFASDQRECLIERERLATELTRLKVAEEIRRKKSTIEHISQLTKARADHALAVAQFNRPVQAEPRARDRANVEGIEEARATLRSFQQSLSELKRSPVKRPPADPLSEVITTGLSQSQRQRDSIVDESKSREKEAQKKLVELIVALDDQAADYQREIAEYAKGSAEKEKEYELELTKLQAQVVAVQQRRRAGEEQRKQKIGEIQREIASVQSDFAEKMRNAHRIAEKLRARLENAKLRREGQLRGERQRAGDSNRLFRENSALRVRAGQLEADLTVAKEALAGVRRELTAVIGPGRTRSLFI